MGRDKFSAQVEIKGGVASSFTTSVAEAVTGVARLSKEAGNLARAQGQIKRFTDGGKRIEGLSKRLEVARKRLGGAREELAKAAQPTDKLTSSVHKAEDAVRKLERSLESERSTLMRTGDGLRRSGIDTRNLSQEQERLESRTRRVAQAMQRQESAQRRLGDARGSVMKWAAGGAAVAGAAYMGMKPLKSAARFEESKIDFSKFVAGADTDEGLAELSKAVLKEGAKSLMGTQGIAQLVRGYGKIGMDKKEALEAAIATETMGVGLEMTADEASTLITKIKTGMKLNVQETLELGDAMNYIGDVTSASGKGTAAILQRQGALIKSTTTLTDDQIVALAASFEIASQGPETAATAVRTFLRGMSRGMGTTKMGKKAWGLMKLSPERVAAEMQKDGVGTMVKVLRRLAKVEGKYRDFAISRIFGEGAKGEIGFWLGNVDEFEKNLRLLDDRTKFLGRSAREQAKQLSGLNAKWTVFTNKIEVLRIKVGDVFLPEVSVFMDKVSAGLDKVNRLIDKHPEVFKRMVMSAGGIFLLSSAFFALGTALAGARFAMAGLNAGMAQLAVRRLAAKPALADKGSLLGPEAVLAAAALSGRRGRGAGGGKALMAGASLASVKGWGRVGAFLVGLLNPVRLLGSAVGMAGRMFSLTGVVLRSVFVPVLKVLAGTLSFLLSPIGAVVAGLAAAGAAVWKYWEPVKAFCVSLKEGFMDGWQAIRDGFGEVLGEIGVLWRTFDEWSGLSVFLERATTVVREFLTPIESLSAETNRATVAGRRWGWILASFVEVRLRSVVEVLSKVEGGVKRGLVWMREFSDSARVFLQDSFERIKVSALDCWNAIAVEGQRFFAGLGAVAASASGPFVAILGSAGVIVRRYLEPLKAFVVSFGKALGMSMAGSWSLVKEVGEALKEQVKAGMGLFTSFAREVGALWRALDRATGLTEVLGRGWEWLSMKLSDAGARIVAFMRPLSASSAEARNAAEAGRALGRVLGDFVTGQLRRVRGVIERIVGVIGRIQGKVEAFSSSMQGLYGDLAPYFVRVKSVLGRVWEEISGKGVPVLKVFGVAASRVFTPFVFMAGAAVLAVRKFWEPIKAFTVGFVTAFREAAGPVGELLRGLGGEISNVWRAIDDLTGVSRVLGRVWGWMEQIGEGVIGFVMDFWRELDEATGVSVFLGESWGRLCDVCSALWGWFSDLLSPIGEVADLTNDASAAGARWGKIIGGSVVTGLKILTNVLKGIVVLVETFEEVMVRAFDKIREFCEPILTNINKGFSSLADRFSGLDLSMRTFTFGLFGEKIPEPEHDGELSDLKPPPSYQQNTTEQNNTVSIHINGAQSPEDTGRAVVRSLDQFLRLSPSSMLDDAVMMMS